MVLWFSGCKHACVGCHNPESWDVNGGQDFLIDDILDLVKENFHNKGITLSGGDPLLQAKALKVLLPQLKTLNLNVWLYSGDVYEYLIKQAYFLDIVEYIDVLVDGRFVLEKLDLSLDYRGSKNQRLIDVKKSLKDNQVVLYKL